MNPARIASGIRPLVIAASFLALPAASQNLSTLTLSATSVTGGTNPTGTVTLSANAPSGGKVVTLSSGSSGVATVAASVTVASGTKTKTFVVTTLPQPSDASAVISAVLGGVTKTATLAVKAPVMSAASVAPTSVTGGTGATLTVTLTGNAPAVGKLVTLSSGTPLAATVPASVTVPSGSKTATAAVTTLGVNANATVTLTATAGGIAKTASLTVAKPALTSLAIAPTTIPGGGTANGTLTLTGPAGPAGATVTLSSSKTTVATVPPSKLIPAGQSTATFTVTGTTLPAGGTATITATWGTVSKPVTVTLQPSASLQSVGLAASSVRGGQPVAGTVTISSAAPSGGVVVSLASDLPAAATVPATVTVLQGQTTAAFAATTLAVGSATAVTVTATSSGVTKTAPLTVEPATLTSLTISPASIPGGTTATGTLTLDGPAGPSGATVGLYSNDTNVATVPANTLIPAGQSTGSFTVTGSAVAGDATTTVFATLADATVPADVTVTRPIGALVGTVKDASTGFTLPWAHVVLTADPARETWSDGDGEYALSDVVPGVHTVEVTYEGFASATSSPVTVANGATATVPPVSIAPNAGRISGTILDQTSGNPPLEGVLVTDAVGLRTATTDGNGHYELTGLAPGFTYLVISRNGYHPTATGDLSVNADGAGEANVGISPVSEGDRPGLIEGVVRDAAGLPVSGATVSVVGVAGLGTMTGADGRYALVVPAADAFVLEVLKAGHQRALSRAVRASAGNRPYHVAHDFVLPLAGATGTIELRVFDPVSRTPFRADVWFRTPEGVWHAPVSETGIRTISGVPAGVIWGCAGPRIVPPGGTLTLRCPGESIVPPGSPRWAAAGIVMNRYSIEPVEGATATFVNGATVVPATTDANGFFSTHSGPVGDYSVTVTAPGFLETSPWLFSAADQQENGSFYFAWLWPEMPSGSVSLTTPAEGAVLTTSPIQVALSFTPARPGDQLLWAWAWASAGNVTSVTPSYSADGTSAVVTIEGTFPNGPLTLGVDAVTKTGAGFTLERSVTVAVPSRPTSLTVTPASVGGESLATAVVTIDPPAPAGGVSLGLASSSPVVTVPATLFFAEGETTRSFDVAASQVAVQTTATISATAAGTTVTATLTVDPRVAPPLSLDLAEGGLSGWQGFAAPPWVANVSLDTTRVRTGSASLKFVTDSGFDCGVRYVVPGGTHWDLRGIRFLTFWSFGDGTDPFQGEQPVVVLRGPAGSIRLQPPAVQTANGVWRFHRVPLGEPSDWTVTTEGAVSLGDITSFEIHQDTWGMGLTVFYDGVSFASDIPEDLAEGTAALWGTFASDDLAATVVDDGSDVRSGSSALRFDTASGFDTGLVFPKPGGSQAHWDLSDVRAVTAWIRAENEGAFQENSPVLVLRSPAGSVRYEPGEVLLNTPGWRYYEIPLDGAFPWTRTQEGTPDISDVTAIELHGDTWGYGFRLQVDGVSVGRPLPLLKLPSASTPAGSTVTASVFLSDAAPAGGRTVLVSSSDSGLAAVPASVVVPEGARSVTFAVTAGSVTVATPVSLTVADRGFSAWTTLRIDPVVDVTSLTLGVPSVVGGLTVAATVRIAAPAWAGGTAVTLTSSNPAVASGPAVVTVVATSTIASFSVTTAAVASDTPVTFTASAGAATATASLTVVPAPPPELSSLVLTPLTVLSGASSRLTVSLAGPAPVGGAVVALAASPAGLVSFPAFLTVAAGATSADGTVSVPASTGPVEITFTATVGSSVRNAGLSVAPPAALVSVSASPAVVNAGASVSLLVTLISPAPPGGKSVSLTSSLPEALAIPATVTVAEGATTASATATAPAGAPDATVTITATDGPIQRTATVAVVPATRIAALSFAAPGGFPGETVTGTVTLAVAAPIGGYSVNLVSSSPGVISVPASVVVPAGQLSTPFPAAVAAGGTGGIVTVSASRHGVTKLATVASVTFTSLRSSWPVAGPRVPIWLDVILNDQVLVGRVVDLTLSSSNPAVASVPATAQIPVNMTHVNVPVTRTEVDSDTSVEFTVTALGVTRTVTVVFESFKVLSVVPRSGHTTAAACATETMRVTANATAPAGGTSFELQVENGSPVGGTLIPGSSPQAWTFVLPAGQSTLDVSTRASWTPEPRQLVTTARLGLSQAVHTMAIQAGTVALSASPSTAPRGGTVRLLLSTSGGACDSGSTVNVPATSSNSAVLPIPAAVEFKTATTSGTTPASWYLDLPVPATAHSGVARLTFSVFGTMVSVDVTVPEASLSGLSLNPTEAPSGAEVTGVVTLDAPAPEPGVTILLGSSDPSRAVVPVSVLVPAGVSSVSFPLIPQETAASGDATISATLGAGSRTTSFRTLPANAARILGTVVDATHYDFDVPISNATATHLPGSGQFLTAADGAFRLYAEPGTATVQVTAPGFVPLTTAPATLAASEIRDLGTLRMRRPGGGACGLAGTVVDPQGNAIDGAQGVLEGYDLAVTTDGAGHYVISLPNQRARYRMTFSKPGYQTWTEDVTPYVTFAPWFCPGAGLHDFVLDPSSRPRLIRGTFEKTSMLSRSTARIEVVLSGGAPAYGANVSVARSDEESSITSYDQISIYPGDTGAGKVSLVQLPEVSVPTTVQYALFYGGETKWTSIEVVPETVSITCPSSLSVETTASCTLTLKTGPAPEGGAVVVLTSSAPQYFSVPASITVPAGQTSAGFSLTVGRLTESLSGVTLKGSWAGGWGERSVGAARPDLTRITVSPVAVLGGSGATGTVTINHPAYPTYETEVTLESTLASIAVPAKVTIAPGESTATFPIVTTPVTQPTTGIIRGRLSVLGGAPVFVSEQRQANLLLTTSGLGLVCTPTNPVGGSPVSCQVSLPGSPAPAGGIAISVTSSSSALSVPASVIVPEGSFSNTFTVTTTPTVATTSGVIRATLGAEAPEVVVTVRQPTLTELFVRGWADPVESGLPIPASIRLDGPAPAGGLVVALSVTGTAASVPASVLVAEGASWKDFEVTTSFVATVTEVVLSASSGSVLMTKPLTLRPQTWRLSPLAPGRAVAGAAGITLYGREFLPSNSVYLAGPVYSATAPDTPLCDEPAGACPGVTVQGVVPITPPQPSADRIVFTVPSSLSPGYYTVRAKSAAGALSAEARWLLVDSSSPVVPALAPEQHGFARTITSGQTVTGTFVENGDTSRLHERLQPLLLRRRRRDPGLRPRRTGRHLPSVGAPRQPRPRGLPHRARQLRLRERRAPGRHAGHRPQRRGHEPRPPADRDVAHRRGHQPRPRRLSPHLHHDPAGERPSGPAHRRPHRPRPHGPHRDRRATDGRRNGRARLPPLRSAGDLHRLLPRRRRGRRRVARRQGH
ncbi:MAG: carboxypeptidase regulatory-like domain-containing protein [Holophagales bacterium]|nr:carboxypeptidase regulatory-like domain-containing protein [Holophagales bacterium]